jgi:DnaJ-class molecular chaperone
MFDLSMPNDEPGPCAKCKGIGIYRWGPVVDGTPKHSGTCFSCQGTGAQTAAQIHRNRTYNRFKIARLFS